VVGRERGDAPGTTLVVSALCSDTTITSTSSSRSSRTRSSPFGSTVPIVVPP
jgi:hypothetical protein